MKIKALFDAKGFTEDGLTAYGQLRSQGFSREETIDRLITADKLRRAGKTGLFG